MFFDFQRSSISVLFPLNPRDFKTIRTRYLRMRKHLTLKHIPSQMRMTMMTRHNHPQFNGRSERPKLSIYRPLELMDYTTKRQIE